MATFTVTNNNDSGDGSLRQAILAANATSEADTITFASGLGTIRLASPLTITSSLTIDGDLDNDGFEDITISGDANNNGLNDAEDVRLFSIATTSGSVVLDGLNLTGGRAQGVTGAPGTGNGGGGGFGGALFIEDVGSLTVRNSTFTNNTAIGGNGASGQSGFNGGVGGGSTQSLALKLAPPLTSAQGDRKAYLPSPSKAILEQVLECEP
ncbi:hypothetical protein [Lyngbya confervoides]|uniref:Uncharacterized protein n=1 Tax=Lyngbya confervoides BDU141951 TaxID=1574623 RepID=A0ABD4SYX3_9CYAN|nr:hypothetical protein [Lyngbya confervoides]MCM1981616.1 hypothetical protein [Lyngbya confervoides BDU141951]